MVFIQSEKCHNDGVSRPMIRDNDLQFFKSDPMVKSARLCSKLFRNKSLGKMAIYHQENSKKRSIYHFVWSITPRFLTRILKT